MDRQSGWALTLVIAVVLGSGSGDALSARAQSQLPRWVQPLPLFSDLAADTVVTAVGILPVDPEGIHLVDRSDSAVWSEPGNTVGLTTRDVDGDGRIDVFVARKRGIPRSFADRSIVTEAADGSGFPGSRLYWNDGADGFVPGPEFAADEWHVEFHEWLDLDDDGRADLIALVVPPAQRFDPGRELRIWRQSRPRHFDLLHVAGPGAAVQHMAVRDLDRDGDLDVVLSEQKGPGGRVRVLSQESPFEFTVQDIGEIPPSLSRSGGVIAVVDLGDDGRDEVLLLDAHPYWENRGEHFVFERVGDRFVRDSFPVLTHPVHAPPTLADVDGDGRIDMFVGQSDYHGGRNRLLLQRARGRFVELDERSGLHAGYRYTCGMIWGDVDNDGRLDGVQPRFAGGGQPTASGVLVRLEDGADGPRFGTLRGSSCPALVGASKAACWFDPDGDGDLDLVFTRVLDYLDSGQVSNSRDMYLQNRSRVGHWLQLDLAGTGSPRSAVGSRVEVIGPAGRQTQWVGLGGTTAVSSQPLRLHFGLGTVAVPVRVVVHWTSGRVESFEGLAVDRRVQLVEGTGVSPLAP